MSVEKVPQLVLVAVQRSGYKQAMLLFTATFGGLLLMMGHHSRSESLFYYFRLEDHDGTVLFVTFRHFIHAGFIEHVKDALEASAVDPQCITIELTESLAMSDVAATGQTMSQLRALGVKLSIDDFGTGYSSLSYLRRFPVDALKIDQSFVATMDAENYAIVKTIVGLARNLDLKVVAEGVETIKQHQLLALAGCASAQGYLFAEPMPTKSVGVFIESNRRSPGQTKQIALARSTAGL